MKKLLLSFLFIAAAFVTQAQDYNTTYKYLVDKLNKVYDYTIIYKNGKSFPITSNRRDLNYDRPEEFSIWLMGKPDEYGANVDSVIEYKFDSKYIESVIEGSQFVSDNSAVGYLIIKLSSKTCIKRSDSYNLTINTDTIYYPYVRVDPDEFNRLKKAWLHFAKLKKEEERDLFDN